MLISFVNSFESRFDRGDIASFWTCRDLFQNLIDEGLALRGLNGELQRIVDDVSYTGDWRPDHLLLHRGEGYALSIAKLEGQQRFIHTSPFLGYYISLDGAPLVYDQYVLPAHYRNELFDPTLRLVLESRCVTAENEILELRTQGRIYDFAVSRPQLILKLTTAPYHTLEWLFSRDTLSAWQANDADLRSTQLRVASYLLGRLADPSSIEAVKGLVAHPNHSVRWAAVQALGRLSRSDGMAQLKRSIDDPHPHIRRAAQKALSALGSSGAV